MASPIKAEAPERKKYVSAQKHSARMADCRSSRAAWATETPKARAAKAVPACGPAASGRTNRPQPCNRWLAYAPGTALRSRYSALRISWSREMVRSNSNFSVPDRAR
uniref:Membrane-bound PQQ-dependent dehydrogenase, glucose/quinate/shikimate family n=1 Tax=Aurantimonas manganoxydans TaxID=651183 RepID=A0A0N7KY85_9HYPH|nr:membrane-bound PQQ-dependent dehydrogenase, glucose/quinate/shikimate family [Aurantimonas manganoxydans SI85-9A1]